MKNFTLFTLSAILFNIASPQFACAQSPLVNLAWVDTTQNASLTYPFQTAVKVNDTEIITINTVYNGSDSNTNYIFVAMTKYNTHNGIVEWEDSATITFEGSGIAGTVFEVLPAAYLVGPYIYVCAGVDEQFTLDSLFVLCGLVAVEKLTVDSGAEVWSNTYATTIEIDSSPQTIDTALIMPTAITADAAENVYITGIQQTGPVTSSMFVLKIDSNGNQIWSNAQSTGIISGAAAIALSPGDTTLTLTGFSGTAWDSWAFVTATVTTDSGDMTKASFSNYGPAFQSPAGLVEDYSGRPYIAGTISAGGSGTAIEMIGYDTALNQRFAKVWSNADSMHLDSASRMQQDADANILITGYTTASNGAKELLVLKYNTSGTLLWSKIVPAPANATYACAGNDIAADAALNVYVTGKAWNGNAWQFITLAYDPSGTLLWQKLYSTTGANDVANDIVTDNYGNVLVSGMSTNGGSATYLTLDYQQFIPTPCPAQKTNPDTACPTITYIFRSGHITTSGSDTFEEFDIYAMQNTPSLYFSGGTILFTYSNNVFGAGIVDSSNITVTRGTITADTNYTFALIDTLMKSDAVSPDCGEVQLSITAFDTLSLFAIADTAQQLCHIKMKKKNQGGDGIRFDQFFMENLSFFQNDTQVPYTYVYTGPIRSASGWSLQYQIDPSSILLWPSTNPTQLWFDIQAQQANSNDDYTPTWASGEIVVGYGSAFFSDIVNAQNITVSPIGAALWTFLSDSGTIDSTYTLSTYDNPNNSNEFIINVNANPGVAIGDAWQLSYVNFDDVAHVVMDIGNCNNPLNISFDSAAMQGPGNSYFDGNNNYSTTPYSPVQAVNPPSSVVNAPCSSHCTGNVNMAFSFSDFSVNYDTSGPSPTGGKLQFTVNFSPVSDTIDSGFLFSTKILIDYNASIGTPFTSWRNFQVIADPSLVSNGFTLTDTIFNGSFLVTIQAPLLTPLPFAFEQGATPLFTLTMPFDNTDISCDVMSEVAFDSVMNSDQNSGVVLTAYETGNVLSPTPVCSQEAVPNNDLYNQLLCPPPVITDITSSAGCYTAGSFDEVTITGNNFLNGYVPTPGDTTTYPKIFLNDANDGCCSGITTTILPVDILNCSQTKMVVLLPGSSPNSVPAGSGLVALQTPAGAVTTGSPITIHYANENDTTAGGNALMLYQDTATINKVFYLDQYLRANADVVADITNAIADINCYTGTSYSLDTSLNTYIHHGGHNLIYLSHDPAYIQSNNAMQAHPYYNYSSQCYKNPSTAQSESNPYGNYIEPLGECDIAVGDDGTLNTAQDTNFLPLYGTQTGTWQYSATDTAVGIQYDFMTFIIHEFGHCALLGHSTALDTNDANTRVMYPKKRPLPFRLQSFNGDADDIAGVVNTFQRAAYIASTGGSCSDVPAMLNTLCTVDTTNCGIGLINSISNPANADDNAYFEVSLYPNPSANDVIIQIDATVQHDFQVEIFNLLGQRVIEQKAGGGPSLDVLCNTSSLASGIYLVEVKSLAPISMEKTLKFIKL